jgi:hypothetical protein
MKIAAAVYDADCWASGKTKKQIQKEADYIKSMWLMGRGFQFPRSAAYQYSKEMRLREILEENN